MTSANGQTFLILVFSDKDKKPVGPVSQRFLSSSSCGT